MLKCKDVVARAGDYLDQEQTGLQRLQFRLHLMLCLSCRRFVRQLRLAIQVAGRCASQPLDPQSAAQISQRCQHHKH